MMEGSENADGRQAVALDTLTPSSHNAAHLSTTPHSLSPSPEPMPVGCLHGLLTASPSHSRRESKDVPYVKLTNEGLQDAKDHKKQSEKLPNFKRKRSQSSGDLETQRLQNAAESRLHNLQNAADHHGQNAQNGSQSADTGISHESPMVHGIKSSEHEGKLFPNSASHGTQSSDNSENKQQSTQTEFKSHTGDPETDLLLYSQTDSSGEKGYEQDDCSTPSRKKVTVSEHS